MAAPTNILFLPVCVLQITTATNADWLDGLEYWDAPQPDGNPIDLAGIRFAMEVRTSPPVATVVLRATTENGFIRVYANSWQLLVPAPVMAGIPPADYVFDLLGIADGYTRNLVQAQATVLQGITRSVIPFSQTGIRRVNVADGMPYAA
jgi:hypothetical protein